MMANYPRGNIQQVAGNIGLKYRSGVNFGLRKWEWLVEEYEGKAMTGLYVLVNIGSEKQEEPENIQV